MYISNHSNVCLNKRKKPEPAIKAKTYIMKIKFDIELSDSEDDCAEEGVETAMFVQ